MRSQEVMRKVGADKDQQGRWKILEMCWMTVGLEALVLWGENLHGAMGIQMVSQFRRGWIE